MNRPATRESIVREIKRRTRMKYSSKEKIKMVLGGLRGEAGIAEFCRREGVNPNIYYRPPPKKKKIQCSLLESAWLNWINCFLAPVVCTLMSREA